MVKSLKKKYLGMADKGGNQMRLYVKNPQAKENLIKAINELNYQQYITWIDDLKFEINEFRFKEVRNRIEADKLIEKNSNLKICDRCNGKGILKEFITALNDGRCFKCLGYGYLPKD